MTTEQTEHNMLMQFIEDDCYVNTKENIEYPPVALSYGEKLLKTKTGDSLLPIPLGTYGNLSCVSAPPKTKKTFFISLLASVYLSDRNIYGGDIKGHRGNGNLVHFDTEQSKFHASKVFKRPYRMTGQGCDGYHTLALRALSPRDRMGFIEWYLENEMDNVGFVVIDGIA